MTILLILEAKPVPLNTLKELRKTIWYTHPHLNILLGLESGILRQARTIRHVRYQQFITSDSSCVIVHR
jgi:hypothetical protein